MSGGWTEYTCQIDDQAHKAFEEAIASLLGAQYSPVAVASQVVAGMNYRFFCNAQVVVPGAVHGAAMVSIFAPLDGRPFVTGVASV